MRILAIADVEDDLLIARLEHAERGRYDLVVSCGDLSAGYLDCVASLANAPLAYVRGNHDVRYEDDPHLGGTNLDGRIEEFGGLRFAGLEGSLDYREGIVGYNQAQMRRRVVALGLRAALTGGIDVLVTHAMSAVKDLGEKRLVLAGGVASNGALRAALDDACRKSGVTLYCPPPILCTDNAAMIAAAGYYRYLGGQRDGWDLNAIPNLALG